MDYIIIGIGVVIIVSMAMVNRTGNNPPDPALKAARKIKDSVHITDDGSQHGAYISESHNVEGGNYSNRDEESEPEEKENAAIAQESQEPKQHKQQQSGTLDLIWAGKGGRIEVKGIALPGPMVYWSNGAPKIKEPSAIDVTLPVKIDENAGQPEIPSSYEVMSPEQRGAYLRWLSRGRMGAASTSYFRLWFFGIERRAIYEKKDAAICLGEISSRLPSLLENPALPVILRFMTCVAVMMKYPPERLALDLRHITNLPQDILNVLLAPYAGSEMRLPPLIAYTIMRNAYSGNSPVRHNDEQLSLFAATYMETTDMGMTLMRPKAIAYVTYFPTNPTLSGPKPLTNIEAPDFFKDSSQFSTLIQIWDYIRNVKLQNPTPAPRKKHKLVEKVKTENSDQTDIVNDESEVEAENIPVTLDQQMRSDLDSFIQEKLQDQHEPLLISLLELSELIELEAGERPTGSQRRGISEITRTGGRLLIPELGILGKIYHWEDLVSPVWVEIGDRISDAYRCAAILFEFAASFTGGAIDITERKLFSRKPTERRKKLKDILERLTVHFELSKEESDRMAVLMQIFEHQAVDSQNLAVSFQSGLQVEDRMLLRDFFYRLCAPTGDSFAKERDEFLTSLSALLEVEGRPQPVAKSNISIGEALIKALKHLFRSEELSDHDQKKNQEEPKEGIIKNNEQI
ncbi:MAG: TerB N-terminal domain-containing protein [Synergistaceae bacterium]|nr:TerB N-terminal domain-containing protein [Synergistaceae bacterium]